MLKMYPWVSDDPDKSFHASEADQKKAFEEEKRSGIYKQLWRGKGKSADQNGWETLEKWSQESGTSPE